MTLEEVKLSIERLRAQRASIPALRDYKPQKGKKVKEADTPIEELFADLLKSPEEGGGDDVAPKS